jgi:hypothetical protein
MKRVSRFRAKNLWTRYRITEAERNKEVRKRGGKCDVCGWNAGDRLEVDHCHKTGKVRGYLCHWCNSGLGLFRENHLILKQAMAYLRRV